MTSKDFYLKYAPVAKKVSEYLGGAIPAETILAAMSWETNYGANRGAQTLNNLAGIKYSDSAAKLGATKDGMYAKYPTLDAFAQDFARVLKLGYYDGIRAAGKTPGYEDDFVAWNKSPYAEHDYSVPEMLRRVGEISQVIKTAPNTATVSPQNILTGYTSKAQQLNDSDKVKYAAVGLAVVGIVALLK